MKKLNNKILIIILVALVGIFALVRIFRTPAQQSNMPKELVALDTTVVTEIKLMPKAGSGEIIFKRKGSGWSLNQGGKAYKLEPAAVKNLLSQLVKLAPLKMVTRKKEKWNDYQVGDSATRVQVLDGNEVVADVSIGRIGFNQSPAQMQQQQFGGSGFGGAFTYVRLNGENEVYTVDGFLQASFNRSLDDFRDKEFTRLKKDDVAKITFQYPDSGFVAEKRDKKWWIGNMPADSNKMKSYINSLERKNASAFADDFQVTRTADLTLVVDGATGPILTLQAWQRGTDWVFATSVQPGVYFSSLGSGIFQTVFERKKNLLPKP